MNGVCLRSAQEADFEAIVRLNEAEVQHTSVMDLERLRHLDRLSCYHKVASMEGTIAAFLLAMPHDAPYASENFLWFVARHSMFVYVDRIVVASSFGGNKLGSLLYTDLFAYARANGVPMITCEYNVIPPNEPSRRFHDKFGFKEVGTQWVSNRTKLVSLQVSMT